MSSEPESHKIAVFQNKEIRRVFADGEWFFSVTDVVAVLTDSPNPGAYWRKLKQRLTAEGSQVADASALSMQDDSLFGQSAWLVA